MAERVPALGGDLWADSARFGEELAAAHALSGGEPKGVVALAETMEFLGAIGRVRHGFEALIASADT